MSELDKFVEKEYIFIDGEDFSEYEYHQKRWENMDQNLKDYARKAIESGARLAITRPAANSIELLLRTTYNGETYWILQGLYGDDPTDHTFVGCEGLDGKPSPIFINRSNLCAGIEITNPSAIMRSALACGKCKEPVSSMSELQYVLYAGAECENCAHGSWEYINSKPSGYWTE